MAKHDAKEIFASAPVHKAVWAMALPSIITQLINIIYNFADTWYVGRTGNAAMVAALGVCFPIFILMAALANLFGVGGSAVISRSLGAGKTERARHVFAFSLYGGLLAAVLYMMVMILFRPKIIMWVGGDAQSYKYVYDYIFYTMILGAIPTVGNTLCGHLVRSLGASKEAGFGMSMGGVLNIILDPLFMFVILPSGMEVTGAAIATALSNTCAFVYFLILMHRRKDSAIITTNPKDIRVDDEIATDVLFVGLPAMLQTTLAMVSNIVANALVAGYGTAAVSGMGVAKKINTFCFNTCMGMTQGVLPLLGYAYGAKNPKRLFAITRYTLTCILIFGFACLGVFYVFAPAIIGFFIDDADSIHYGTMILRIIAFAAPLCTMSYMFSTVFQAAGHRLQAFLLSICRKGIIDIPSMMIFSSLIGITGIVWATPFAEVVSAVLALYMYMRFRKSFLQAQ